MTEDSVYAFEKIGYGKLAFKVDRRKLLTSMISELQAYNNKVDGKATLKLADLGNCSNEQLANVVSQVVPNCKISLVNGFVFGQPPLVLQPFELFPIDIPAVKVFNLFNGMTTLVEASSRLALDTGWDQSKSFAYTRGVFLWLVLAGICIPVGF